MRSIDFKIFKMPVRITWGDTIWWSNNKTKGGYRLRSDTILGFHRIYCRDLRIYVYNFTVGKLKITW